MPLIHKCSEGAFRTILITDPRRTIGASKMFHSSQFTYHRMRQRPYSVPSWLGEYSRHWNVCVLYACWFLLRETLKKKKKISVAMHMGTTWNLILNVDVHTGDLI